MILSLALATPCSAVQVLRGSTVVGGANNVVDHAIVQFGGYMSGDTFYIALYNSAGTRIALSASGATREDNGTTEVAFTGGPTLTTGTYYTGIAVNGSTDILGTAGTNTTDHAGITWPTVPSTLPGGGDPLNGNMCIGIYNSDDELLLGNMTGCSVTVPISGDNISWTIAGDTI